MGVESSSKEKVRRELCVGAPSHLRGDGLFHHPDGQQRAAEKTDQQEEEYKDWRLHCDLSVQLWRRSSIDLAQQKIKIAPNVFPITRML